MLTPFHLAFHVRDLDEARAFYCDVLGCKPGRSAETWFDIDFFGHQLSLHKGEPFPTANTGKVGDHMVPMPHLGVVLPKNRFDEVAQNLQHAGVKFILEPTVRFPGENGEQWTIFFADPSGNPIEVKGFADMSRVFSTK
ncbi:MAG: VOC family protein [Phycisphaeraceae bacterium]|nr:VOC family protein [Phycisphaerales bacterium]MCB9859023.1 VOC family protein [Phycisphaeraceae bacterium]